MRYRIRSRHCAPLALALALAVPAAAHAQGVKTPHVALRTAIAEINTLRTEYAEAFNKHDAAALAELYSPDARVIMADGTVLVGRDAIGQRLAADAPNWPKTTFASDTVRVSGSTAWDVGTLTSPSAAGGGNDVSHYLVVLRRGLRDWKLMSVAVVPESHPMAAGQ